MDDAYVNARWSGLTNRQRAVLIGIYQGLRNYSGEPDIGIDSIREFIPGFVPTGYLVPELTNLVALNFLKEHDSSRWGGPSFELTGVGLRAIEISLYETQIPAADRFVNLNHNTTDRDTAVSAFETLADALMTQAPNDLFATADQRLLVVSELRYTVGLLRLPEIRVGRLAACSPLLVWLADRAAGGVIGDLAMAALKALAPLIGLG